MLNAFANMTQELLPQTKANSLRNIANRLLDECQRVLRQLQHSGQEERSQHKQKLAEFGQALARICEQMNMLHCGDEIMNIDAFMRLIDKVISDSYSKVNYVAMRSMTMVYALDSTMTNLDEISSFINRIQSINRQAKRLALNASIEAVRAGDAGKGFGIVADEMKEISEAIAEMSGAMRTQLLEIHATTRDGYKMLEDIATHDFTQDIEMKEKIDLLMHDFSKKQQSLTATVSDTQHLLQACGNEHAHLDLTKLHILIDEIGEYLAATKEQ